VSNDFCAAEMRSFGFFGTAIIGGFRVRGMMREFVQVYCVQSAEPYSLSNLRVFWLGRYHN
jgi:hypothetical protein